MSTNGHDVAALSRMHELRALATRLRLFADELWDEAQVIEDHIYPNALKGREIAEHSIGVLRERGPMHCRELLAELEVRGRPVRGLRPVATLVTNLARHPEIRQAGRGIYAVEDRDG